MRGIDPNKAMYLEAGAFEPTNALLLETFEGGGLQAVFVVGRWFGRGEAMVAHQGPCRAGRDLARDAGRADVRAGHMRTIEQQGRVIEAQAAEYAKQREQIEELKHRVNRLLGYESARPGDTDIILDV